MALQRRRNSGKPRQTPHKWNRLLGKFRVALQTADLTGYRELLDSNVTWGAPDDMKPSCRNRDLAGWPGIGVDEPRGCEAMLTETVVRNEKILVGLKCFRWSIRDPIPKTWPIAGRLSLSRMGSWSISEVWKNGMLPSPAWDESPSTG